MIEKMFCLGVVLLAALGVSHKLKAQTTSFQVPEGSIAWTVPGSTCFSGGKSWPTRNGVCFSQDADRVITPTTGATTSMYGAKCEEGWTIVLAGSGYKCARELREPK